MQEEKHKLIPSGIKDGKLYTFKPNDTSLDYTVDRASTGTRVNKEGLIETVGNNIPRIDYSTGEAALLVEEQATNLISDSKTSSYSLSQLIRETGFVAPDGTNDAIKYIANTVNDLHYFPITLPTLSDNTNYTATIFAKASGHNRFSIEALGKSGSYIGVGDYDLTNVTSDNSARQTGSATVSTSITSEGNGWYRCELVATMDSGATSTPRLNILVSNGADSSYAGDGVSGIYIWGAQLEEGSKATSYIPTNGSTVTRLKDNITTPNYITELGTRNSKFIKTPTEKKLVLNDGGDLETGSLKVLSAYTGLLSQPDIDGLNLDRVQYGVNDDISTELKYAQDSSSSLFMIAGKTDVGSIESILPVPTYGAELVTNGGFDSDTGWIKQAGTTISGGLANLVSPSSNGVYQNVGLLPYINYSVTFTIVSYTSGGLDVWIGGGSGTQNFTSLGTYTIILNQSISNGNIIFGGSNFIGSIDNVSVREVLSPSGDYTVSRNSTATYVDKDGIIQTAAIDVPRIDYSTGVPVVLREEQATNLIDYSEDIGNANWGKANTSVSGNKIISSTVTNQQFINTSTTATTNTEYILSGYFKADGYNWLRLAFGDGANSQWFDLQNGILGTSYSGSLSEGIQAVGDGWYKCWTSAKNTSNVAAYIFLATADQVTNFTGDGSSGILAKSIQLEQGSKATSYIPTNGATVTRLADTITNTNYLPQLTDRNTKYIETPTEKKLVINSDGDLVESTKYLSANQGVMTQANIDALAVDRVQYGVNDNIYSELKSAQDNNASLAMIAGKGSVGRLESILPVPTYGAELITNGGFDTDTGWTKGNGAVISGGLAYLSTANAIIEQAIAVTNGKLYRISYTVVQENAIAALYLSATGFGLNGLVISKTEGENQVNIICADETKPLKFVLGAYTSGSLSIDNVSVREVLSPSGDFTVDRNSTATYVAKDGLIKTAAANEPRFDFSDGSAALLVEPQATNLLMYSEDFSQWTQQNTITTQNVITAPDNTLTADLVVGDNISSFPRIEITANSTGVNTLSCYVKKYDKDEVNLYLIGTGLGVENSASMNYQFKFSTKTLTHITAGTAVSTSVLELENGWFKISMTASSTTITHVRIYTEWNIISDKGIYLWGAQLETGSVATSYIPTAGATVTRLKDNLYNNNAENLIGQTEGTLFLDFELKKETGKFKRIIYIEGDTTNGTNTLYLDFTQEGYIRFPSHYDGALQVNYPISDAYADGRIKIAGRYDNGVYSLFVNGVLVDTKNMTPPNGLNKIILGGDTSPDRQINSGLNTFKIYPSALTDAQLITITSL